MRARRRQPQTHSHERQGRGLRMMGLALFLLALGFGVWQVNKSKLLGNKYRYNLVVANQDGRVAFVSFDPQEKQTFALDSPAELDIRSRSYGTYRMSNLLKLGSYENSPGSFVRRKVQGFMRVPIEGFIVSKSSSDNLRQELEHNLALSLTDKVKTSQLDLLDKILLLSRTASYEWRENGTDELIRAGVIEKTDSGYSYNQDRLKQYLGLRVFDWAVGTQNTTVAIVNNSGEDGMANDISEYLGNLGFDVVNVKSGTEETDTTRIIVANNADTGSREVVNLLSELFEWNNVNHASTDEYRAKVVIILGKDAAKLF